MISDIIDELCAPVARAQHVIDDEIQSRSVALADDLRARYRWMEFAIEEGRAIGVMDHRVELLVATMRANYRSLMLDAEARALPRSSDERVMMARLARAFTAIESARARVRRRLFDRI